MKVPREDGKRTRCEVHRDIIMRFNASTPFALSDYLSKKVSAISRGSEIGFALNGSRAPNPRWDQPECPPHQIGVAHRRCATIAPPRSRPSGSDLETSSTFAAKRVVAFQARIQGDGDFEHLAHSVKSTDRLWHLVARTLLMKAINFFQDQFTMVKHLLECRFEMVQ
jgi:hypothetical protein